MPDNVRGHGRVMVRVIVCAPLVVPVVWLENFRACEDRLTTGTGAMPVPLRLTDCGLPVPSSMIPIVAVRLPVAVGAKVTLMTQLTLRARVVGPAGQLLVCT